MRRMLTAASVLLLVIATRASAQSPRVDVVFEHMLETPPGEAVFVIGSLPQLGAWDPRQAVKLTKSDYPTWRVRVSLPADREFSYAYITREDGPGLLGDPANVEYVTPQMQSVTPAPPAARSPIPRRIVIEADMVDPVLYVWPPHSYDAWQVIEMQDVGNGATPGTTKWAALDFTLAGQGMEFIIFSADGGKAPGVGTFSTPLNEVYVRDEKLHGYVPPAIQSDARLLPNRTYYSNILGENRTVRILLPRNYGRVPGKRYPVLYMHDGQGLMGTGRRWMVDTTVPELVNSGAIREIIVVGIDNSGFDNRFRDYVPDGDSSNYGAGASSNYTRFIRDELKPLIDAEFLTYPDAGRTGTMGSSLGACCAMFQGWLYGNTFRRVGALSGSWGFSSNFNQLLDDPSLIHGLRIYLDSGDAGPSSDNYGITNGIRETILARPPAVGAFAVERNFRYRVGYGDEHDEYAWARRLPIALKFLYPANEDQDGLKGLVLYVRGDVNGDHRADSEDLYAAATQPVGDIDNDGVADTEADMDALRAIIRVAEIDQLR